MTPARGQRPAPFACDYGAMAGASTSSISHRNVEASRRGGILRDGAGDDDDEVEVGHDLDELTAEADRGERSVPVGDGFRLLECGLAPAVRHLVRSDRAGRTVSPARSPARSVWVTESTRAHVRTEGGYGGDDYGYQWWVTTASVSNRRSSVSRGRTRVVCNHRGHVEHAVRRAVLGDSRGEAATWCVPASRNRDSDATARARHRDHGRHRWRLGPPPRGDGHNDL
jgi:hypothetical protein